jgi:hypothetical protein
VQGLAPWTGAGGAAACLRKKGRREWRHGCGRHRAGKGSALEEADRAGEDEQPEQQGRAQGAPGLGVHGCWPTRGVDHGDCRWPWSRRGAGEGMSSALVGRYDALEERRRLKFFEGWECKMTKCKGRGPYL